MNNNIVHHTFHCLWYEILNKDYTEEHWMNFEAMLIKAIPLDNPHYMNILSHEETKKILEESSQSVFITTNLPDLESLPWCLKINESPVAEITHGEIIELLINKRNKIYDEWVTTVGSIPNIIMR